MIVQVQATFAGGLQDHLQAARGVEANAASQLQDALQDARHVTAVLQQNVATDVKTLSEYAISSAAQQHCDATQQGMVSFILLTGFELAVKLGLVSNLAWR